MSNESTSRHSVSRRTLLKASLVAVGGLGMTGSAAANGRGNTKQTADVFGQGMDGPVVAEQGATIRRTKNGISMTVSMPTPEPGTYTYPTEGVAFSEEEGPPEVFTLWAFTFDEPGDGAYAVAGHVVGGPNLTLSGRVSTNTEPLPGWVPLENPTEAGVRLAVAPHGALDPELMPEALRTPTGPGPDVWWLALFDPPA